jgi:hypothetical protein
MVYVENLSSKSTKIIPAHSNIIIHELLRIFEGKHIQAIKDPALYQQTVELSLAIWTSFFSAFFPSDSDVNWILFGGWVGVNWTRDWKKPKRLFMHKE